MGFTGVGVRYVNDFGLRDIDRLLDSKLSPVKGFMGSNPLSMIIM